jgi:hypothetical protein
MIIHYSLSVNLFLFAREIYLLRAGQRRPVSALFFLIEKGSITLMIVLYSNGGEAQRLLHWS